VRNEPFHRPHPGHETAGPEIWKAAQGLLKTSGSPDGHGSLPGLSQTDLTRVRICRGGCWGCCRPGTGIAKGTTGCAAALRVPAPPDRVPRGGIPPPSSGGHATEPPAGTRMGPTKAPARSRARARLGSRNQTLIKNAPALRGAPAANPPSSARRQGPTIPGFTSAAPSHSSCHASLRASRRGCTKGTAPARRVPQSPGVLAGTGMHPRLHRHLLLPDTRPRSRAARPAAGVCTPGLWSQGKRSQSLTGAGASPGEAAGHPPPYASHGFCLQNFPSPARRCCSPGNREPGGTPTSHRPLRRAPALGRSGPPRLHSTGGVFAGPPPDLPLDTGILQQQNTSFGGEINK